MKESVKKWIDAGKAAIKDDKAQIKCPVCGYEFLEIIPVSFPASHKRDLHLICNNCNNRNTVTHTE